MSAATTNSRWRRLRVCAAHDARDIQPRHGANGHEQQQQVAPEHHRQHDDEGREWHRIQHVDQAHQQCIDAAAEIAGRHTPGDADDEADEAGGQRHQQRDTPAPHQPHQQVASQLVGAQQVSTAQLSADRFGLFPGRREVVIGRQPRHQQRGQQQAEHRDTDPGQRVVHCSRTRGSSSAWQTSASRFASDDQHAVEHGHAHHQRVVAVERAVARRSGRCPAGRRWLSIDDGTGDGADHRRAQECHQRHQRRAQRVPEKNGPRRQPLARAVRMYGCCSVSMKPARVMRVT